MDLDTLDQRIRLLERELAAARWRTRVVCAGAVAFALVFACKSSKATDEAPTPMKQLVIGGVTIDEHGIVIEGLGKGITIKHEKQKTSLSAGMVRVSGDTTSGELAATESSSRLTLRRGDNEATAIATETWASMRVERTKGAKLGHQAELRIGDGTALVLAKLDERSASLWASAEDASAGVSDIKSTGRLEAKAGKTTLVYDNP